MTSDQHSRYSDDSNGKGLTIRHLLLVLVIAIVGGLMGGALGGGVTVNINELGNYGQDPLQENVDPND